MTEWTRGVRKDQDWALKVTGLRKTGQFEPWDTEPAYVRIHLLEGELGVSTVQYDNATFPELPERFLEVKKALYMFNDTLKSIVSRITRYGFNPRPPTTISRALSDVENFLITAFGACLEEEETVTLADRLDQLVEFVSCIP